jgi:hypothetical protein
MALAKFPMPQFKAGEIMRVWPWRVFLFYPSLCLCDLVVIAD